MRFEIRTHRIERDIHHVRHAAPFLFLRKEEAAHAPRDAVADDGFRVIKEEFSREGHRDGDDAVVKMPTPEKLCFFLQMNSIFVSVPRTPVTAAARLLNVCGAATSQLTAASVADAASTDARYARPRVPAEALQRPQSPSSHSRMPPSPLSVLPPDERPTGVIREGHDVGAARTVGILHFLEKVPGRDLRVARGSRVP